MDTNRLNQQPHKVTPESRETIQQSGSTALSFENFTREYGRLTYNRYRAIEPASPATQKNLSSEPAGHNTFQREIRDFSALTGLDLETIATILRVSRQTLYNRFKGTPAKNDAFDNATAYLVSVHEKLKARQFYRLDLIIGRKIFQGNSFTDMLIAHQEINNGVIETLAELDLKEHHGRIQVSPFDPITDTDTVTAPLIKQ